MADNKTAAIAAILRKRFDMRPRNILVVGCGSGLEAAILAETFNANVTGIDITDEFDAQAGKKVRLEVADATSMTFADEEFDCVYSYHALEHIPDFRAALRHMRRVLAPGGGWCVGTPNRSRLIGYLGSKDATLVEKLRWNMADWSMMLRGRFRNEFGAHAGFTAGELSGELKTTFGDAIDITRDYYDQIYERHVGKLAFVTGAGLGKFILPSVYFAGRLQ